MPDPATAGCVRPYHDAADRNAGGPHDTIDARKDVDGGRMDGFIAQARDGRRRVCRSNPDNPACSQSPAEPDVMGYHDWREIPNYWRYASDFVLQDHMFEPDASWSLPSHLFMVSAWSARCSQEGQPDELSRRDPGPRLAARLSRRTATGAVPHYDWTDLTYLLHRHRRELALLRAQGLAARLRRRRDALQGGAAEREDTRNLEPAAVVRPT